MTVNITPVMSKLNMQREFIQKIRLEREMSIPKKLKNKIASFNDAYAQVKSKAISVNAGGRQAFRYAGNPKKDTFKVVDANAESHIKEFIGVDSIVAFGNEIVKELCENK